MPNLLQEAAKAASSRRNQIEADALQRQQVEQLLTNIQDILVHHWENTKFNGNSLSWSTPVNVAKHPDMQVEVTVEREASEPTQNMQSTNGSITFQFVPTEPVGGVSELGKKQKLDIHPIYRSGIYDGFIALCNHLMPRKTTMDMPPHGSILSKQITDAQKELNRTQPQRERGKKLKELLMKIYDIDPRHWRSHGVRYTTYDVSGPVPDHPKMTVYIEAGWASSIRSSNDLPEEGRLRFILVPQGHPKPDMYHRGDYEETITFTKDCLRSNINEIPLTDSRTDQYITLITQLTGMIPPVKHT